VGDLSPAKNKESRKMGKFISEVRIRGLEIEVSDEPTVEELREAFRKVYEGEQLKADFIVCDDGDVDDETLYSEWGHDWTDLERRLR
jgi:hypothetical protein